MVLTARFLGAAEFGRFSYFLTLLTIATTLSQFGTAPLLGRDLAADQWPAPAYWGNYLLLRLVGCGVVGVLLIAGVALARPDLLWVLAAGAAALPLFALRSCEPLFQVQGHPRYGMYAALGYAAAYSVTGSLAAVALGSTTMVMAAYLLAGVVYALIGAPYAWRLLRPQWRPVRPILHHILRMAVPIGVSDLFIIINTRADILMLAWLRGDAVVGVYNAAFRFVDLAAVLALMLVNPLLPIVSRMAARTQGQLAEVCAALFELLAVVLLPCAVLLMVAAAPVLTVLFGADFAAAAPALQLLAPSAVLVFYSLATSAICLACGVVRYKYWSVPLAAALNIAFNLWWIPRWGAAGAAAATTVCECVLCGITAWYVWRLHPGCWRARAWGGLLAAQCGVYLGLSVAGPGRVVWAGLTMTGYAWYALRFARPRLRLLGTAFGRVEADG